MIAQVALAKSARLVSGAVEPSPSPTVVDGRRRLSVAIGASALVHATLVIALVLLIRPAPVTSPVVILPVSLVARPGAGNGGGDGGAASAPAPTPPEAEAPKPVPAETKPAPPFAAPRPKVAAKPHARPAEPPAATAAPSTGDGMATSESGHGPGGGGGAPGGGGSGLGTSGASPAYGVNPQPPYPMVARRMGLEGTVVLRVVVAPDGSPASVVVLQSSGHAVLDTAALDTVRTRWRFVPARRNGIPVEDSVQVPIRFHQTEG